MKRYIVGYPVVLVLLSTIGHAQTVNTPPPAVQQLQPLVNPQPQPISDAQSKTLDQRLRELSSLSKVDPEYHLGPGDLIEITVFGVPELTQSVRVSASGFIKLPLLEPVMAERLTAAQLEERLASLLDGQIVKNPQVSVFVKEYRSQPVFVLGAVRSPGQYQITVQLKIVDILTMAGGLNGNAGDEAVIQRQTDDPGHPEIIKVNLIELLEKGNQSLNVPVRGRDVVNIQERPPQTVYVIGEVNRAGAYQLPQKQSLRVTQAFAWAGGPMKTAKMSHGILVRYDEKGARQEMTVDFAAILKGKKEDLVVRANDIIFVPGSQFKNIGYAMMGGVPGTLMNLPYYLPYLIP